jgi:hypothetical protein
MLASTKPPSMELISQRPWSCEGWICGSACTFGGAAGLVLGLQPGRKATSATTPASSSLFVPWIERIA